MAAELELVPDPVRARLGITINGQYGDLPDDIAYDLSDSEVRRIATEAVATGGVPGIARTDADFTNFVVDRLTREGVEPARIILLRPKVPFGA